jgi:hypothetical protein
MAALPRVIIVDSDDTAFVKEYARMVLLAAEWEEADKKYGNAIINVTSMKVRYLYSIRPEKQHVAKCLHCEKRQATMLMSKLNPDEWEAANIDVKHQSFVGLSCYTCKEESEAKCKTFLKKFDVAK